MIQVEACAPFLLKRDFICSARIVFIWFIYDLGAEFASFWSILKWKLVIYLFRSAIAGCYSPLMTATHQPQANANIYANNGQINAAFLQGIYALNAATMPPVRNIIPSALTTGIANTAATPFQPTVPPEFSRHQPAAYFNPTAALMGAHNPYALAQMYYAPNGLCGGIAQSYGGASFTYPTVNPQLATQLATYQAALPEGLKGQQVEPHTANFEAAARTIAGDSAVTKQSNNSVDFFSSAAANAAGGCVYNGGLVSVVPGSSGVAVTASTAPMSVVGAGGAGAFITTAAPQQQQAVTAAAALLSAAAAVPPPQPQSLATHPIVPGAQPGGPNLASNDQTQQQQSKMRKFI